MPSSFNRKAILKLCAGLLTFSFVYDTMTVRFLRMNNKGSGQEEFSERSATQTPESRGATNTIAVNDTAVSSDLIIASDDVTEALERILDFFPLQVPNERPNNKRRRPQGTADVKNTRLVVPTNTSNLAQLIDETTWEVKASIQDQLDFAVIAHAKTGTTFIQSSWFRAHPEIHMPSQECRLMPQEGGAAKLVKLMHSLRGGSSGPSIFGYKNPHDINRPRSLNHFREYFPKTKVIVGEYADLSAPLNSSLLSNTPKGLRHPILWFQSFYRYRQRRGKVLPPPETLVGACRPEWMDVCTE